MCHAPAPSHHRFLSLANSCRAMCPNPTAPTLRNPTSHSRHAFHPHPTRFPSLSLCTFHHSPYSLAIPLSFPHWPSPILATIPSTTCVLKRFPLTSPRKLPCVKRGFLRTAEPHRTSQLSPCAPQVSQCHVYAMPGRDVPCSFTTAPSTPPARELLSCPCVLTPQLPPCAIAHLTPYPLSILSLLACHPLPTRLSSLSSRTFHPFVVSTPAISDSSHVSFHGVRTKTFSTHVTT